VPVSRRLYNANMSARPTLEDVVGTLGRLKPELETLYHVGSVAVFGSYAHHDETPDSDLDLLVSFKETPSLFTFIAIEDFLSEALGVKVDLVMEEALKPNIGRRIRRDLVPV
jgi:uncharacterized protein